ncbi:MAG: hypothetical protein AB7R00_27280 [Kofleriaceae bacterium]
MRVALALLMYVFAGCGDVLRVEQGDSCSKDLDCVSGFCADGVCCDRACDATCESCVSAGNGGATGTCAIALAGTDLRGDCADASAGSCDANGTGCSGSATTCNLYPAGTECGPGCGELGAGMNICDGAGTCAAPRLPTSCNLYKCNADSTACLTQCASDDDCHPLARCKYGVCRRPSIVIETCPGACGLTQSVPLLKAALEARGYPVTVASAADIDTLAELQAFDVLVSGEFSNSCCAPDWFDYDEALGPWQAAGGGVVALGWVTWNSVPTNMAAILPSTGGAGDYFSNTPQTVSPVGSHPITRTISSFVFAPATPYYTYYLAAPKPGATVILQNQNAVPLGAAWTYGQGRVVFMGLMWLDSWASYGGQTLTDGSIPESMPLLIRAIEWAAGELN